MLRFMPVVAWISRTLFFWTYQNLLIYSFVFWQLKIMLLEYFIFNYFTYRCFILGRITPTSRIAGPEFRYMFDLIKKHQFSKMILQFYTAPAMYEFSGCSIFFWKLVLIFNFNYFGKYKVVCHCICGAILLMTKDIEHFFIYLFPI